MRKMKKFIGIWIDFSTELFALIRRHNAKRKAKFYWEEQNVYRRREKIVLDSWLDTFREDIEKSRKPVIDLGCGSGNNTLTLLNYKKKVIPCDLSQNAIAHIRTNFPEIKRTEQFDMSFGLPFEDGLAEIIIADLSLHYFEADQMKTIIGEIMRVLTVKGVLLLRVNSVNDNNFGAGEGKEIEKHLYITEDGRYKRFFDEEDIKKFFGSYSIEYMQEENMYRYGMKKVVWKVKVKKLE